MFDNVGRSRKQSAGRTAGSVLLTLLFNGSLLGVMVLLGTQAPKLVEEAKEKLVAVNLEAPPPPPPPPPPAGGGKKKEKKEKVETPEEVPVDPTVLEPEPEPVVDEEEGEGVKDGVVDGVKDGVVDGVKDGVKDGVLGGQLGGTGIKTVHWSEAQVKSRVVPKFPEAAKSLGLKSERCVVRIVIDEAGVPSSVTFKACPELFKAAAQEAATQWRWYPVLENGTPVKAQFDINFVFKLND